jgi:hypothetical protein
MDPHARLFRSSRHRAAGHPELAFLPIGRSVYHEPARSRCRTPQQLADLIKDVTGRQVWALEPGKIVVW